jgi:ribonuclease HI
VIQYPQRKESEENRVKHVDIYTDGACRGNPGRGGWGAILVYGSKEKELSGGDPMTTNNRMELMAAIAAMEALREPCDITLTSDSKYLTDAINQGWLESWKKRNWVKSDKAPVLNVDLWQRIDALLQRHTVRFVWVHGHQGHAYNERCDVLATTFADSLKEE